MRNEFNLSHSVLTTLDQGELVPVGCVEVLPGDTFIHRSSILARVAPLANPVMHDVHLSVHHWYVPNRILWDGWEDFITGESDDVVPTISIPHDDAVERKLAGYFGIPAPAAPLDVSVLPFRAYQMIWNENYRDQDLQSPIDLETDAIRLLRRVAWEKDYFTTARATPQQGDAVEIGFNAGSAPIVTRLGSGGVPNDREIVLGRGSDPATAYNAYAGADGSGSTTFPVSSSARLAADLSSATGGIDIDSLRRALALQRIAEARARYGARYDDYLRFMGVNPRDGRLSRPEYLGGGRQRINFSEVLATAEGANTEVGDMYGHGIVGTNTRRYRRMFEEHGWVLTLVSVRPKTVYMDAFHRQFWRSTAADFWQREFETLPWQEVLNKELDVQQGNDEVFGYVPRYDEYRHMFDYVTGAFRISPEWDWHFARTFSSMPVLNGSFIECTPTDRPYLDKTIPQLYLNVRHNIRARRLVRANASIGGMI